MAGSSIEFHPNVCGAPDDQEWSLTDDSRADEATELVDALRKFDAFNQRIGEMGANIKVTVERV